LQIVEAPSPAGLIKRTMNKIQLLAKAKPNDRHWYAYDLLFDGEIIVCNSRDPEHGHRPDLARAQGGAR
jgi:hypothetical protein